MSITTDRYATERNSPISSHNYYSRGSAALQKVVKATMEQSPSVMMDQIEAVANLGDWYLIFGQVGSATKAYSLADELISVSSEPELIRNNIFGMGKIINFDEPRKDGFLNDDGDFNLIEVSMTISRSGSALDGDEELEAASLCWKSLDLDAFFAHLCQTRQRRPLLVLSTHLGVHVVADSNSIRKTHTSQGSPRCIDVSGSLSCSFEDLAVLRRRWPLQQDTPADRSRNRCRCRS